MGYQTQAGQEGDQHPAHEGRAGVPGAGLLPHHREEAPLLHHQHHRSLCALLLPLPPRLLLTCQRSVLVVSKTLIRPWSHQTYPSLEKSCNRSTISGNVSF